MLSANSPLAEARRWLVRRAFLQSGSATIGLAALQSLLAGTRLARKRRDRRPRRSCRDFRTCP